MQRTKQALGIAPHEALFKKKQTHTKKFTETLQRIVDHHTNLFFHIFLIAIPTPLSLHVPSKIIANLSLSSAASNSPPLWVPLTLSISSSLSSCHLAHFRRKCFASSTSCPLHSLHFLLYLPLSTFRFQCAAVLSLLSA